MGEPLRRKTQKRSAVFLDRDGTILNELGYLSRVKDMRFYKDAIRALQHLSQARVPLFVVSNQSGIGRGYFTRAQYNLVNRAFLKTLKRKGIVIGGVFICPHKPDQNCLCRKPKPFLLKRAAKRHRLDLKTSFVVGDQDRDLKLARGVKAQGVLVLTGKGKSFRSMVRPGEKVFSKLSGAARWILGKMAESK
jgi:D-glycero-D-manno-heptose 1,7-bisphosphate phosphatase